jgi:TolB-like protein
MKGREIRKKSYIGFLAFLYCVLITPFLLSYEKEIKAIALATAESIVNAGIKTTAVVDFTDLQGNVTELGRFLAEELSVALASAGKGFEVVDRTHLKTLLQEHKLSSTGLIDLQTARKLGQIAGVEALITGSITPFGDSVRLSVKLLNTNTAKIIGASSVDIAKTKAIEELLAKEIEGGGIAPSSMPSSQQQLSKSVQKVEQKNFTFELLQCKMSGNTITCDLLITNTDQDRNLLISSDCDWSHKTRMFDDKGYENKGSEIRIAGNHNASLLVSGIATRASITFDNISPEANKISLMEVCCSSDGTTFLIKFRNIPLIK